MSNPSIASKLMSMVKGIFGQKEEAAEPAPQSASAEQKAPAGAAEGNGSASANGTKTAAEAKQAPAEESEKPADESAAAAPSAAAPAAEDSVKAVEEDDAAEKSAASPDLVTPEERAGVADELAAAEATTQESDDSVLEDVRRQAAPAADELAVPGYDDLTLPSIRARLRKLTIDQVRDLRAYEVAHGERPEFIKMYDNRIAKLQAEES
ncbi:hypothetical protein [Streptomonospora litoralis]|uniref:DUF8129 domain-containing protein n=1 Tax=Streptomonospora litoralis TaxID=2498135 RepID=A0A4P6PWN6_9ACTN|nr:hypothetical protein [Streptomonospora litoralis]QBI52515.1 hypothetical protein EKD16_03520 [Streptomonospora litoralis]